MKQEERFAEIKYWQERATELLRWYSPVYGWELVSALHVFYGCPRDVQKIIPSTLISNGTVYLGDDIKMRLSEEKK